MAGLEPKPSVGVPQFYIFPYGSALPEGIPEAHVKVLLLIRHSQGA